MKPLLCCVPCITKQVIYAARAVSGDAWLQKKVVSQCLKSLAEIEYSVLPVTLAGRMFKSAVDSLGVSDPFAEQRREVAERFADIIAFARDHAAEVDAEPVAAALKMAIAADHFPGFVDLEQTLAQIVRTAKGPAVAFDMERFTRESHKRSRTVLLTGGFLALPFDLYLVSLLGMETVTLAPAARNFLWHVTAEEIRALEGKLPVKAEIREMIYAHPQKELAEVAHEEDLVICKGFINYQLFAEWEQMLLHLLYVNRWCQPAVSALGLKGKAASGLYMKFNV